jgi:PAS domain S-box-containing protein
MKNASTASAIAFSLTELLDTIDEGFVTFDRAWRITYMNAAARRTLSGASGSDDAVGRDLWEAFPVLGDSPLGARYREAVASQQAAEFEELSPVSRRWFHFRLFPSARGLSVLVSDITERKRGIEILRGNEARFRALFEHSFEGVLLTSPMGTIRAANPAACRMLGRSEREICEGERAAIVDVTDPRLAVLLEERQRHGHASGELTLIRGDGARFPAEASSAAFTDEDGNQHTSLAFRDLSAAKHAEAERKRIEQQFAIAERMVSLGTLSGGVSHEINNPLSVVLASLDAIGKRVQAMASSSVSDDLMQLTSAARTSAERIARVMEGLKAFAGGDREHTAPIQPATVIELALAVVGNELRHRARVVKKYGPAPLVEANAAQLAHAIVHLLLKAAQTIPEGRADEHRVAIRLYTEDRDAAIEITDTGAGLPAEVLEHVFDPFFTTGDMTTAMGLGLSIGYRTIAGLGGSVEAFSEVGRGSTFRIRLPPARGAAPSPAAPPPARVGKGSPRCGRLLIIDDDVMVARVLARVLEAQHDVRTVHRGKDAIALLDTGEHYDLILCDIMMPEMSGADVHAAVLERDPAQAARMVFITGGAFTPASREFLQRVRNPRLEKPIDAETLLAAVEAGLSGQT